MKRKILLSILTHNKDYNLNISASATSNCAAIL